MTTTAAAAPAAIFTGTAPPTAQPLEQLGKTTPPAAARKSAPPAYTTTSGRSGSPAARNMSAVRRGEAFPRRLCDNHVRTDATFIYDTNFRIPCRAVRYWSPCHIAVQPRSPCRAVRHPPPSSLDFKRQRYSIDLFSLRASVESSQFRTCPADATAAAQICRATTSAGASFGF